MSQPPENQTDQIKSIWDALEEIKDPEIPVISLVELGVIHDIRFLEDGRLRVTITPTFSGCPALNIMRAELEEKLLQLGYADSEVRVVISPAWSTDRISESGRQKLRSFGVAPPPRHGGQLDIVLKNVVPCPFCRSTDTEIRNPFGPTPCRALHFCFHCQQPFEQFKPL